MELYPYQTEGIKFLCQIQSGILAFEQGLGKTITALGYGRLLYSQKKSQRILVVTRTSLLSNWRNEIQQFWKSAKVYTYHGKHRDLTAGFQIYLTSYRTLTLDRAKFQSFFTGDQWLMICDEFQDLSNIHSEMTRAVESLRAPRLVGLTGTPVRKPEKVYSLVRLVNPFLAGKEEDWVNRYCKVEDRRIKVRRKGQQGAMYGYNTTVPTIVGYRPENLPLMHRVLNKVMLRKTKKDVASHLPVKRVIKVPYELQQSRARYRQVLGTMQDEGDYIGTPSAQALIQLQMLLSGLDPFHNDPATYPAWVGCDKLQALMDLLDRIEGRAILWCKHLGTVHHLRRLLLEAGYAVATHTGMDSRPAKDRKLKNWRKVPNAILIATIKSAGVGLNLTEASTAIFYELEFSADDNQQAEDRIHRLGQTQTCNIYYLYASETIEQGIMKLVATRKTVTDAVVDGRLDKFTLRKIEKGLFGVGKYDYEEN